MAVASERGAGVAAALLVDGNAAAALLESVRERDADVLVMDARHDRSVAERLLDTVAMESPSGRPATR